MRSPMFWLAAAYATGLALFVEVDDSPRILFALSLASLLAGILTLRRRRWALTFACILIGFLLAGGASIRLAAAAVPSSRIDRLIQSHSLDLSEAVRLAGWLRREPEAKPFALFYEVELESLETGGQRYRTSGGVRLAYYKTGPQTEEDTPSNAAATSLPPLHYGDRVEALVRVHQPVRYQNPGSFDWRGHLARRNIFLEGSLKSPALLELQAGHAGNPFLARIQALRVKLLRRLDLLLDPEKVPDENAVLRAMLLGDRSFLQHQLAERFRWSGAYHVLVVSGLHVGMIAVFLFWLLQRLRSSDWIITGVTISLLVFYLLLVEDRPPVERAVWMVSLYLLSRLLFRQVPLSNPASLAALLVLFLHPDWLFDPSFHLSFGAVFLIAFFAVPWMERTSKPYRQATRFLDTEERDDHMPSPLLAQFRGDLRALAALLSTALEWLRIREQRLQQFLAGTVRLGLRVWDLLVISFSVQLGFVLLTALYFERVVWVGLFTNVLVVPLVGVIVPLGLGVLLLSLASSGLAVGPGVLLQELTTGLLELVDWFGRPGLSYAIPPPPAWLAVLHLAALLLLARAVASRRRQGWAGAILAVLMVPIISYPFPPRLPKDHVEVTLLDVGQGDAIFLAFPTGETWLLDGGPGPREIRAGYSVGPDAGEIVIAPFLRSRGVRRLDHVWLSHAHHDHLGGLPALLEDFAVGEFHVGRNPESRVYGKLLEELRSQGIPIREHRAGERLTVGRTEIEILWPAVDYQPRSQPSNNDSLVLRLCHTGRCVLLPGDIEATLERRLADSPAALQAEVLKVPHHGGRGAASDPFLAAVGPALAILSVGAVNPFEHPRPDTIARLEGHGVKVYRTDEHGAVRVALDAARVRVETYGARQTTQLYPNLAQRLLACARRLLPVEFW